MERPRQQQTRPKPLTSVRAKKLRANMSTPERVLWYWLRAAGLSGLKFRRQHPIGPYIADFYCHDAALVVECDSRHHATEERKQHDVDRDAWFAERGIRTLRVTASLLARCEAAVVRRIEAVALERIAALGGQARPHARWASDIPPPVLAEPWTTSPNGVGEAATEPSRV